MAKTGEYVGRLRKTLYRTREAPQLWHKELRRALGTIGFQSSRPHPRVFNHCARYVYIGAQVDDLLVAGPPSDLEWVQGDTKKTCEIKGEMLKHGGMVKFLGREIRLTQGGVACASDPKHAQLLIDEPGLRVANGTDVPLGPEDPPETDPTKEPMSVNEAKFYRRCAAKLNLHGAGQTRPLCCGQHAEPQKGDEKPTKRVGRYLRKHPTCVSQYT